MAEFNTILRELRKAHTLTQDELAEQLHITKQALSHYERGTRYPKRETLEAIADFFNVDMNYLTGHSSVTTRLYSPAAVSSSPLVLSPDKDILLCKYDSLSDDGKALLLARADELVKLGYTAEAEAKKEELPSG